MNKLATIATAFLLTLGAAAAQDTTTEPAPTEPTESTEGSSSFLDALVASGAQVEFFQGDVLTTDLSLATSVTVTYADGTEQTYPVARTDAEGGMVFVTYEVQGRELTLPLIAVVNREAALARAAANREAAAAKAAEAKARAAEAQAKAAEAKARADSARPADAGKPATVDACGSATAGGSAQGSAGGSVSTPAPAVPPVPTPPAPPAKPGRP